MTQLAASIFFFLALLASLVAIHVTVKLHWARIVSALKGELGATPAGLPVGLPALPRRHAAS